MTIYSYDDIKDRVTISPTPADATFIQDQNCIEHIYEAGTLIDEEIVTE